MNETKVVKQYGRRSINLSEVQQFNDKYFGEFWELRSDNVAETMFLNALKAVQRRRIKFAEVSR